TRPSLSGPTGATGAPGTSGTGKSNASRTISASSSREYSGTSSRPRISVQRSAQGRPSSSAASAHGDSSAGTKRPPPSCGPGRLRSTASLKLTRSAGLPVLVSRTRPPHPAACRSDARIVLFQHPGSAAVEDADLDLAGDASTGPGPAQRLSHRRRGAGLGDGEDGRPRTGEAASPGAGGQ